MELTFFPDFFIIGAPRCGTTSLSRYLERHPQICFSKPKEPHYFSMADADCTPADIQAQYLARFFRHYHTGYRAVGEGSVSYLYSPQAVDLILKCNPAAKFLAMVRNPIDMIHSYHYRMLFTLDEDIADFSQAWALQNARSRGEKIPRRCRDPHLLQYAEIGKLAAQIERLFQKVTANHHMVIVFDDFVKDTLSSYRDALAFINVEDDGRTSFPPKMVSKSYRIRWLQQLCYRPPRRVMELIEVSESRQRTTPGKKKPFVRRLRKRLTRFNTIRKKPPPLDDRMRAILRDTFSCDIKRLETLLGRDLGHWT